MTMINTRRWNQAQTRHKTTKDYYGVGCHLWYSGPVLFGLLVSAAYVKRLLRQLLLERPLVSYNLRMEKCPEKGKHTPQMGKMQMILHLYQPILLHHETTKKITQDIQTKTCTQSHMSYKPSLKSSHKVAMHHALCTTTIALKESCDGKPTLMRRYNTHIFWHAPMTKL